MAKPRPGHRALPRRAVVHQRQLTSRRGRLRAAPVGSIDGSIVGIEIPGTGRDEGSCGIDLDQAKHEAQFAEFIGAPDMGGEVRSGRGGELHGSLSVLLEQRFGEHGGHGCPPF
ncbi:hypothetical protein STRTUCAR8_10215 [Streptomyces turgidiscabies Car8]|uniref:Uncharacterized protein n=1 Tax=Streptomyces turgidiscabies (strain Car8) TaxID=698760 RepID=L7F291_STRT8|nr:hypothetical protein STRTUCAR8_10215 [Streptomyces turgidiscabies Car8]